jgi:hypothetical protein
MRQISRFRQLKNRYRATSLVTSDHEVLSNNKVTGWSVNFPIVRTCKPSKVCAETCYGLTGPIIWSASLEKQTRNYNWVKSDPESFSRQLEREVRRKLKRDPKFFLRWNGVGDLFDESVAALKSLNRLVPELPIWCVTRIPEQVSPLKNLKNVWVHFSLDKHSLERRVRVERLTQGNMKNLFFSYQTDKGEQLKSVPEGISVLFFDKYQIPEDTPIASSHPSVCPLNLADDISNVCHSCRRCFNGDGVRLRFTP